MTGLQDKEVPISNASETTGRRQPEQNGNSHDLGAPQRELMDEQALLAQDAETMVSRVDRWNPYADSGPVPLRYSWTGRPRFAAPGIMEDRLPLNPDIPEHLLKMTWECG